jgi:hypothetical protein
MISIAVVSMARALGSPARKRLADFLALQQAGEKGTPRMTAVQKGIREK